MIIASADSITVGYDSAGGGLVILLRNSTNNVSYLFNK